MSHFNNIVLTSEHQHPTRKHVFRYDLPTNVKFSNHRVALIHGSIFNQFFNISARRNNNIIKLKFLGVEHVITFPDGFYHISDIDWRIQQYMFVNNLYVTDVENKVIKFIEIMSNDCI